MVFVRRMLGDHLVSRIFYRVVSWVWTQNEVHHEVKKQLQDKMLYEMFGMNGAKFAKEYTNRVPVKSWDNKHKGWITSNRLHSIAQRVALFGPLAGILGRTLEHELQMNPMMGLISYSLMEKAMKEKNVLKDADIEEHSWDYWDTYHGPGRKEGQAQLTSNEPAETQPAETQSASASAVVLIPSPMYTDRRERGRSRCDYSLGSSASRR